MKVLHFNFSTSREVRENTLTFDLTIDSKFILLEGDSGSGKSSLNAAVTDALNLRDEELNKKLEHVIAGSKLPESVVFRVSDLFKYSELDVCILDEDYVETLRRNKELAKLERVPCHVILIYRESIPAINVSYKDYKVLRVQDDVCYLVQKYPTFDTWINAERYLVEDSRSGFQYYHSRLSNVATTCGRDNITKNLIDGVLIADGSALSAVFPSLLKSHINMFLPDSFEALVVKHFYPDIYSNKYALCEIKCSNYEYFFETVLQDKSSTLNYSKKELLTSINESELIQGLSEIPKVDGVVIAKIVARNFREVYDSKELSKRVKDLSREKRTKLFDLLSRSRTPIDVSLLISYVERM